MAVAGIIAPVIFPLDELEPAVQERAAAWAALESTITESTFVARFLLDPRTDTADSAANVDAFVDLPDGATWALTIFSVDEVARLLALWKETGEVANGSYFWAVDQLIVPEPGVAAMTAAIRELVRSGDITSVGIRCDDPD